MLTSLVTTVAASSTPERYCSSIVILSFSTGRVDDAMLCHRSGYDYGYFDYSSSYTGIFFSATYTREQPQQTDNVEERKTKVKAEKKSEGRKKVRQPFGNKN